MKVILMKPESYERAELEEYFQSISYAVESVYDALELTNSLTRNVADLILYNVTGSQDFGVIRYINSEFPKLPIVVTTDTGISKMIENLRICKFRTVSKPFHLEDLGDALLLPE